MNEEKNNLFKTKLIDEIDGIKYNNKRNWRFKKKIFKLYIEVS